MEKEKPRTYEDLLDRQREALAVIEIMPSLDVLQSWLESASWRFAKTMPRNPHWYTLRSTWADQRKFNLAVHAIYHYGSIRYFWRRPYLQLDLGDYTYWAMGWPVKETILINRKRL